MDKTITFIRKRIFKNLNTNSSDLELLWKMWLIWVLFVFAILALIAGYTGFMMPEIDKRWVWFQRSGSIIVYFGVIAELFAIKSINGLISWSTDIDAQEKYKTHVIVTNGLAIVMALIGTAIWGYGDLIFQIFIMSETENGC